MRRSLLLLAVLVPFVSACDSSEPDVEGEVTVMTQNLYLGGDLFLVAGETNPNLIPVRVAQLYGTIVASDPAARMAAIAAEIADQQPALVGLQEVSTYYVQSPADNLPGGAGTSATVVTYDFLDLLLDALAAEGATYTVAHRNDNADIEFPATTDGATFFDVRYRDADVILARSDVSTTNPMGARFSTLATTPVGGVDVTFVRGWQSVAATVNGVPFTFFNTHLEVGSPEAAGVVQVLQGQELRNRITSTAGPVILVGDINSDAGGTGTATYGQLTTVLSDAYTGLNPQPTCCQADDLLNASSAHSTRIDVVLHRGFVRASSATTFFDDPSERISTADGGLRWPSDHAGVSVTLVGSATDA